MEIRWDTSRMAELVSSLDSKRDKLSAIRRNVLDICRQHDAEVGLRHLAIASEWAGRSSRDLAERRRQLVEAEAGLLWQLEARAPLEGSSARLRSRSISAIEADLDSAFERLDWLSNGLPSSGTAGAELRAAELTYELAVAQRNEYLLGHSLPRSDVVTAFTEVIDILGYQIARARPRPTPDWRRVGEAADEIRRLLNESWFGDVGRADLLAIQQVLAALGPLEIDEVLARLSSDELYRWFHELDGVRGGNLNEAEEADLFAIIARTAGASTLFALAGAEAGTRFAAIAAAVRREAPPEVAIEFIEICATEAAQSDDALVAPLAGLAALDTRHRSVAATALTQAELLGPITTATVALIDRQSLERDSALVVEFFKGVAGALHLTVTSVADLSVAGLVDRHRFREAWSNAGGVVATAFNDPLRFAAIVLDLETLRRNPARWTGAAVADVGSAAIGRLARLGRLGRLAQIAAQWLQKVGRFVLIESKRVSLSARHVAATLQEITEATSAAAVSDALDDLDELEEHVEDLEESIEGLDIGTP